MAKQIGVIAEDVSDVEVVNAILSKYVDRKKFGVKHRVGYGCGKLRKKCTSWIETLFKSGCHHVLVLHDLDRNSEMSLRETIRALIPAKQSDKVVVVIPVEELEAWLLADPDALRATFNLKSVPKRIADCEKVMSPKEKIAELVWQAARKRYINTVHNRKLAEASKLQELRRCPSFRVMDEYIQRSVFKVRNDV